MQRKPITYLKWAFSVVLPSAVMYYLFLKTNTNGLLVFIIALGICTGLLFAFRLVILPGTPDEKEALQEETILKSINTLLNALDKEAELSKNDDIVTGIRNVLAYARTFVLLLAGDDFSSTELAKGVRNNIQTLVSQLRECNRLAEGSSDRIYQTVSNASHAISQSLQTMVSDYKAGRIQAVELELTALSRQLMMQGYISNQSSNHGEGKED